MVADRRQHLVDTALKLFYRHGFHATGIDTILAEAGVAKMTLYKHFKSKDELILAVLRRRDELFRNWFMREVERRGRTAPERLLALFDVYDAWLHDEGTTHGCLFINATAEFAAQDDPIHTAAAHTKQLVLGYVRELATAAGADHPDTLARQLVLLLEGATVTAQVTGNRDAADEARQAAEILIQAALEPHRVAQQAKAASVRENDHAQRQETSRPPYPSVTRTAS
jgi:AcrR family transcriptional regulator